MQELSTQAPKKIKPSQLAFLVFILLASLFVRRIGLDFGRPLLTHPDEQNVLLPVVESVRLDRNMYKYAHPTQVLYRLDKTILNSYSQLRYGINLANWYDEEPNAVYLAARTINASFGALIPILAFFIGRRFKPDFSVPAALLFAFFPQYILHSHYITPDIPITFYTLGVLLACLLRLEGQGKAWLWVAVFFAALNTAEKYPGVISLAMIAVSLLIIYRRENWSFPRLLTNGLWVTLAYILALFIIAPNLFLQYRDVISAISNEARNYHLGNDGLSFLGKLAYYAGVFWEHGSIYLLIFAALGIVGSIRNRLQDSCLLFYGFFYGILLSVLALHHERWALPIFISPLLLAAYGSAWLLRALSSKTWLKRLAWCSVVFMLSLNVVKGITRSVYMDLPDTSAVSLHYLNEHGFISEQTLYEGYTPYAPFGKPDIYGFDFENPEDIKYVILSSKMYERYQAEPLRYSRENAFYKQLEHSGSLLMTWEPLPYPRDLLGQLRLISYYLQNRNHLSSLYQFSGYTIKLYKLHQ
jgi:hypothetical protein